MQKNFAELRKNVQKLNTSSHKSGSRGKGALTISITYNRNGNRVTLSEALYEKLDKPKRLQFACSGEDVLLIGKYIEEGLENFKVSTSRRPTVYSTPLFASISEYYGITYGTEERNTSDTFHDIIVDDNIAYVDFSEVDRVKPKARTKITDLNEDNTDESLLDEEDTADVDVEREDSEIEEAPETSRPKKKKKKRTA